jgi:hypothetical protein
MSQPKPETLAVLLNAVAAGASLEIYGPSKLPGNRPEAKATIESESGALLVELEGPEVAPLLDALADKWLVLCNVDSQ